MRPTHDHDRHGSWLSVAPPFVAPVASDPTGRTNVPGVWVARIVTDLPAQVVVAAAGGATAAARIHADLVAEDVQLAVAAAR